MPTLADLPGEGTAENPYELSNASELRAIEQDMTAHYVLVSDVDASDTATWNDGRGFATVGERVDAGDPGVGFRGTLDGRNHTVANLTIGAGTSAGLFYYVNEGGVVENLRLADVTVTGDNTVGAVTGYNDGTIRNVVASGTVSGSYRVGGLVGALYGPGSIVRSGADVDVEGDSIVGGLVGDVRAQASITRSYAVGAVTSGRDAGGLAGDLDGQKDPSVIDSYARGAVDGAGASGGFVGRVQWDPAVRSVYATGAVSGDGDVGGLVGYVNSDFAPHDASWSADVAGVDDAYGATDSGSPADPSEQGQDAMTGPAARSSLPGLSFDGPWLATDGPPILAWQVEDVTLAAPDRMRTNESPSVDVRVLLRRGDTVTATTTAAYETNASALSVTDGTLSATDNGTVAVTASLGGHAATDTVEVRRPPNVSIQRATVPHERVGSDVGGRVNVTLTNDGGPTAAHELTVQADGEAVASPAVEVPGYGSRTVTLEWNVTETGRYEVAVGNVSAGTLAVVAAPSTTVDGASASAERVAPDESVTVTATVDNAGNATTAHTLEVTAGDATVASRTVLVPPGGRQASFSWQAAETGSYELAVDGTSAGTVTVRAATDPSSTTAGNGGTGSSGTSANGSGFGPLVALVALVAVALYGRRSR